MLEEVEGTKKKQRVKEKRSERCKSCRYRYGSLFWNVTASVLVGWSRDVLFVYV